MTHLLSDMSERATTKVDFGEAPGAVPMGECQSADILNVYPTRWWKEVNAQVRQLRALEQNWDKMGGTKIRNDVINFSLHMLEKTMDARTPAPNLTPLSNGGIIIEWHEVEIDFEIEVDKPFSAYLSFEDKEKGVEDEAEITLDLEKVAHYVLSLTRRVEQTSQR